MGLLDIIYKEGKQYLKDAMPGGLLNRELDYQVLRNAGEVASMTPTPIGDVASGLLALDDLRNRQYGSAALNSIGLLPFVPGMAGMVKNTAKIRKLPLDQSAYTAISHGGAGQEIFLDGVSVGMTKGKLKNAPSDFVDEVRGLLEVADKRSQSAKIAAINRAKNKTSKEMLKAKMIEHGDLINSIHKTPELNFTPLDDLNVFKRGEHIYQSPSYGNKPGSAYRLVDIGGEPAYARLSNHWGNFSARSAEDFDKWNDYRWTLPDVEPGKYNAGYILLSDLLK